MWVRATTSRETISIPQMLFPKSFNLPYCLNIIRTFINARIKWVQDPYLDFVVEREKNLKQALFLKNHILSSPTKTLPLSTASLLKPQLDLPFPTAKFVDKYPFFFSLSQLKHSLPHVMVTRQAQALHKQELEIFNDKCFRDDAVRRLAKVLMLTKTGKLPFFVIDRLKYDLGLPHNFVLTLLCDYPEYFSISNVKDSKTGENVLALELVSWRKELAVSALEEKVVSGVLGCGDVKRIKFPMSLPKGFDLEKKVRLWVEEWQDLPYISPYEDAFHLASSSDQAEKWTVAVMHELLWLMVSKKTERDNLFCFGEYLGFGKRIEKALKHHPGIFYVSNKIRTQTVVLREAFRKDFLVEKHPLMGMRYRYIHLLNKVKRRQKRGKRVVNSGRRRHAALSDYTGEVSRNQERSGEEDEKWSDVSCLSEYEDFGDAGLVDIKK